MSTSYFVAADWLIEHSDDPEVQIIDARMVPPGQEHRDVPGEYRAGQDRKSTRLNSSHRT